MIDNWNAKNHVYFGTTIQSQRYSPAVDIFRILQEIPKIENKHGEIRNIKVGWNHKPATGSGKDYDPGYYDYWIEFERMETDAEETRREKNEARIYAQNKKDLDKKMKEEKKLLKDLLAKYGGKNGSGDVHSSS